jgi:hypothetical protein
LEHVASSKKNKKDRLDKREEDEMEKRRERNELLLLTGKIRIIDNGIVG